MTLLIRWYFVTLVVILSTAISAWSSPIPFFSKEPATFFTPAEQSVPVQKLSQPRYKNFNQLSTSDELYKNIHQLSPTDELRKHVASKNWEKVKEMNLKDVNVRDAALEAAKHGETELSYHLFQYGKFDSQEERLKTLKSVNALNLDTYVKTKNWDDIMRMKSSDFEDIDASKAVLEAAKDGQSNVVKHILNFGSEFSIDNLLEVRSFIKDNENQLRLYDAMNLSLKKLISDEDVSKLQSLVKDSIFDGSYVYNLAMADNRQTVATEFKSYYDAEDRATPATKEKVITPSTKSKIPSKTILETIPTSMFDENMKEDIFKIFQISNTDPKRELLLQKFAKRLDLDGVKYNPVKILGNGDSGTAVLYQDEQGKKQIAVKVTYTDSLSAGSENPISEEAHLLRKAGLLEGKSATSEHGFVFTPMKFVEGKQYEEIYYGGQYNDPESMMKQVKAIDEAFKSLEDKGIEYRDAHMGNLMYDPVTNKATLIDFGHASSSTITDANGKKINLFPTGGRKRFLDQLLTKVDRLSMNSKDLSVRKKYDKIVAEILKRKQEARALQFSNWDKVNNLLNLKQGALKELDKKITTLKTATTAKELSDLQQAFKTRKGLLRELQQLETTSIHERDNLDDHWSLMFHGGDLFGKRQHYEREMFNTHQSFKKVKALRKGMKTKDENESS